MSCECCGWDNPLNEPIRIGLPMCGCDYGWCNKCNKCPRHCKCISEELIAKIKKHIERIEGRNK